MKNISKMYLCLFFSSLAFFGLSCKDNNSNSTSNNNNAPVLKNDDSTIVIGAQGWMRKNLDVSRYRNGDSIPQVTDPAKWASLTSGAWCYYKNDSANGAIYGKLYNWYAVNDSRGLAPKGWHVSLNSEWVTLAVYCGGYYNAGTKLKEAGKTHWTSNFGATNETGFTGLPGGWRYYLDGSFGSIGINGTWWTSTIEGATRGAWNNVMREDGILANNDDNKGDGFSVRCLRD